MRGHEGESTWHLAATPVWLPLGLIYAILMSMRFDQAGAAHPRFAVSTGMSRPFVWISRMTLASVIALGGCQTSAPPDDPPQQRETITFNEIAPIIFDQCAPCHRPGQVAPLSLLTYADVKRHADEIAQLTRDRVMPPWPPEVGYGEFRNARLLSDEQIDSIQRWVASGAIEGDPEALPPTPEWPDEWQLGEPDLVVDSPPGYTLRAEGPDVFRNFVIPLSLDSARYVRGVEFRPGNTRLVHHTVIRLDRSGQSRRLDEADREPGYSGMVGDDARSPGGRFLGWTPGKAPRMEAPDMAWQLEPGTDLVINLHLMPTGRPEDVQFRIGFFFTDRPPERLSFLMNLGTRTIDIPAGQKAYRVTDSYVLPTDVEVLSVYPHAHYLAKEIKGTARLPDGSTQWLIWIKNWNFNWQDVYVYRQPIPLPRGTTVSMEYIYDNSSDNRRNPHDPPERVMYGPTSTDEMADLWFQVLPRDESGRAALERDHQQRQLTYAIADAIADVEKKIEANPRDAELRNFLGTRYLEIGRAREAIPHLEQALRLRPAYAEAHSNLGSALQAEGQLAEAINHFRQAVSIAPGLAAAHNNLGVALAMQGQADEAVQHFQRAVEISPGDGDARTNLGAALRLQGQIDEAMVHLRRAVAIDPQNDAARGLLRELELGR